MFNFAANRWFFMLSLFCCVLSAFRELIDRWLLSVDNIFDFLALLVLPDCFGAFICTNVATVTIQSFFFTVHQFTCCCDIMFVCWCRFYMMNQPAVTVNSYVHFVAKVPCIALFSRVCFRIPFLFLVLGGWGCFNKCRINNGTFFKNQTALQQPIDYCFKDRLL